MTINSTNFSGLPILTGGKGLRHVQTANGRRALSWDDPGSHADVDVVADFAFSGAVAGERFGIIIRGAGASSTETGWIALVHNSNGLTLGTYDGGTPNTSKYTDATVVFAPGYRYRIRLRASGSSLRARVWQVGTEEPESWNIDETDAAVSGAGWVGVFSFQGTSDAKYCDYFAVDTGGGSAPLPGVTPGANQYATDFGAETVSSAPSDWTQRWATTNSTWTVVDAADRLMPLAEWIRTWGLTGGFGIEADAGYTGGMALRQFNGGALEWKLVRWTEIPESTDMELLARFRINTGSSFVRDHATFVLRAGGETAASRHGYGLRYGSALQRIVLTRWNNGSPTQLDVVASGGYTINAWQWVRFQAIGTTIRARTWNDGDSEPGSWQLSATDAVIESGGFGVGSNHDNQNAANIWDTLELEYTEVAPDVDPPLAPELDVVFIGATSVGLETGVFQGVEEGDEHASTRWQVTNAADTGFASPVWDVISESDLTFRLLEELDPETAYIGRALHTGDIGGDSDWSNVVEFTTEAAVTLPDTPTVTLLDRGEDFVTVEGSEFSHPDGAVAPEDFDPEAPQPYHGTIQWRARVQGTSWDAAIHDPGLEPFTGDLELTLPGLDGGTTYEFQVRYGDGLSGELSEWSTVLAITTLEVPAVRPDTPTVSWTICSPGVIIATGSTYSHPDLAVHGRTQWEYCPVDPETEEAASCVLILNRNVAELTEIEFLDPAPGMIRIRVRYQDIHDAWSLWSEPDLCNVNPGPEAPEIRSPSSGAVFQDDFTLHFIRWPPPLDPVNEVVFQVELSTDLGLTWEVLAVDLESVGPEDGNFWGEYTFSISGRPNGKYLFRVAVTQSMALEDPRTGDWAYVLVHIDRTGVSVAHKDLTGLDAMPESWVPAWDTTDVSWSLVDEGLGVVGEGGSSFGILARRNTAGTSAHMSEATLLFTELGEPVEGEFVIQHAVIANEAGWYPWRFSQIFAHQGGLAFRSQGTLAEQNRQGINARMHLGSSAWAFEQIVGGVCPPEIGPRPWCPCRSYNCLVCRDIGGPILTYKRNNPDKKVRYGLAYNRRATAQVRARRIGGDGTDVVSTLMGRNGTITNTDPRLHGGWLSVLRVRLGECYHKWEWVTSLVKINRLTSGGIRLRQKVFGAGFDPSQEWHIDSIIDRVDDEIDCGPCGLSMRHTTYLTNDQGVLFKSFSAKIPDSFVVNGPLYGAPTVEATP